MAQMMLFSGNANPKLAGDIAEYLGIPLGQAEVGKFSDGEIAVDMLRTSEAKTSSSFNRLAAQPTTTQWNWLC